MKVAVISPNPSDGTAWYRSSLPLIRMQQKYADFQFQEFGLSDVSWDILMNFDILFLQRPCSLEQLKIARQAQFFGLKVWVDYDDMLWDIHPSSPVYAMYNSPHIKDAIEGIMTLPNITITVSTKALQDQMKEKWNILDHQIFTIPNCLEARQLEAKNYVSDCKRVLWRGSETHVADLDIFRGYYDTVMLDNPDVMFDFFGYNPWYWTSRIANARHIPGSNLIDYFLKISTPQWKVWVCMLEDTPFNRCKSNILYLEATMAGAVCVCPAWPEWKKPGTIIYENIMDFNRAVQDAIYLSHNLHCTLVNAAREYIQQRQNLSYYNLIRYNLFHQLLTT